MSAAHWGQAECARALLVGGADRTLRATGSFEKGKTALEIAEEEGHAEVAALLREGEPAVRLPRSPSPAAIPHPLLC